MAYREVFHFIVPFYNVRPAWLKRCLESIHNQHLEDGYRMEVHVVDDASTEEATTAVAQTVCERYGFNYHRNQVNQKCPHNLHDAIQRSGADEWDVFFIVDGDDYLPHSRVLHRVSEIFAEEDTWLTYGQYMSDPPDFGCTPAQDYDFLTCVERSFRKKTAENQYFNHPLIFRRFLWDAVPIAEFKRGRPWFETGYDRVIMLPMLELATDWGAGYYPDHHWRFINEVLYVYNSINEHSEAVRAPEANVNELFDRSSLPPLIRRTARGE